MELTQVKEDIVITKMEINRFLYAMIGRAELVDAWWDSANKQFEMKTPNEIYLANADGRKKVYDYVLGCSDGYW